MLQGVQQKISCIFETFVEFSNSSKRSNQSYTVQALNKPKDEFIVQLKEPHIISEKIDGTSTFVKEFNGKPWLWARHDRKLNKKFQRKQKNTKINDGAEFKLENYKDVPENWIASEGCLDEWGKCIPDVNGHIMGWIPIDPQMKQHCWHHQTIDFESGLVLTLKPCYNINEHSLEASLESLKSLEGCTMELIGTNINGNAYNIGSKKVPMHFLITHGIIEIKDSPKIEFTALRNWFLNDEDGKVEGMVWHCGDSKLYKLHRHHMKLDWPIECTKLSKRPLLINIDIDNNSISNPYFKHIAYFNNKYFHTFSEFIQSYIEKFVDY